MTESENNGPERDEKGKFGPGNPGRPRGTANKVSMKVKESIVKFLEDNMETIQEDFDKLKPRERLQFISDILSYATPKLSAIQSEVDANVNGNIVLTFSGAEIVKPDDEEVQAQAQ